MAYRACSSRLIRMIKKTMTTPYELTLQTFGDHGPPLLILHGLFGSSRNWTSIARHLQARFCVFVPDLRNHGASPHSTKMDYPHLAADIQCLLKQHKIQRTAVLGHSMGGKIAMWLALTEPASVGKLIVVDIAPVAYRQEFGHIINSLKNLPLALLQTRGDADNLLANNIAEPGLRQFLLQNLVYSDNRYQWRIDLNIFKQALPNLASFPPTETLTPFNNRSLFIAGGNSSYDVPSEYDVIQALFPQSELAIIESAGHWLHAEQPARFLPIIDEFLANG